MIAAGWTAVNRLLGAPAVDDYGDYSKGDLVDVITAPGQYQGYGPKKPLTYKDLATDILSGAIPDPTGGATYMGNYYPGTEEYMVAGSYAACIPEEYHSMVIGPSAKHKGEKPLVVANFEYHNKAYDPLPMSPPGRPQWK
jgi:hypothetical protein